MRDTGREMRAAYAMRFNLTMKTETKENKLQPAPEKPGFFTRILNKVDASMKAKADEASKSECCSGDKKDKSGKCC